MDKVENIEILTKKLSDRKAESLNDQIEGIYSAFYAQFPANIDMPVSTNDFYIDDIFPDYVIICSGGKYWKAPYSMVDGAPVFSQKSEWVQVEEITTYEEVKAGSRHSAGDRADMQKIHDIAVSQGANCEPVKSVQDSFVAFGENVKVLGEVEGGVKVGGNLITYGSPQHPDLSEMKDFFTSETKFGLKDGERKRVPIFFNHGMPLYTKKGDVIVISDEIGEGEIWLGDTGVLIEAIIYNRKEYEKAIAEQVKYMGWSSGALGHVLDRKAMSNGTHWVKRWVIGEASATPTPAEYRNSVIPLKSLLSDKQAEAVRDEHDKPVSIEEPVKQTKLGVNTMEIDEVKLQEMLTQASEAGAQKAIAATEPVKSTGSIQVTEAEEDRPFKSIGENLLAVKEDFVSHGNGEKKYARLRFLKATGASEGVPTDGGLLLDPTIASEIIKPMHEQGPFSNQVRRLPVGNNSNSGWINAVDETSRATGSRWGGVRGYRLAEGQTKTASKPTFRRIQWELKKYAAVVVATDELLADAAQFSEVVRQAVPEELNFMLNDDIMNGVGLAGPAGFMQSDALITVTRDTGSKILGADISAMYNRMDLRGRNTANWYIGNDSAPQLDNLFAVGSTAVLYPYAAIRPDGVKTLYGRPVITTEFNASLNTTGDIVFFDPNSYLLWEKGGIKEETSIHVYFLSDETAFRFVYRVDGHLSVASALTPYKGSTTTSPAVALTSAT